MAESPVYSELNKKWKQTCKIVLGSEMGELSEYAEWLSSLNEPILHEKSSLSGKEVTYAVPHYCGGSKRASFDEVDFLKRFEPLGINEVKDIDSIISAVQERIHYTGNIILGNSKYVEKSSNISDSFWVFESSKFGDSKYIAYSTLGRQSEHIFGTYLAGESSFLIRCQETYKDVRGFELWRCQSTSDSYYSYGLTDCADCTFSFGLMGKRHAIGNLELPRQKYSSLKEKLLEEMREELLKGRKLPSLSEITGKCGDCSSELRQAIGILPEKQKETYNKQAIETAFSKTTQTLLGRPLSGIDSYKNWLQSRIYTNSTGFSATSKTPLIIAGYACFPRLQKDRLLTAEEEKMMGEKMRIEPQALEKLSLKTAHEFIAPFAYFSPDYAAGTNPNMIECAVFGYSRDSYRTTGIIYSKFIGYSFWQRTCDYSFGSGILFDSSFCLKCYNSVKLNRCFEVDSGRSSSDCCFSHNIENVQDGMFCFNVKNLKYAIGNAEVGREKYLEAKRALQEYALERLETGKKLGLDIYNLGCKAGPKPL